MISVPADGEANLRAGRPIVKKNISVPHTTAVLKMPTRDTDGYYPVLEGLKEDDKVVTEGSFILKAEAVRQYPEFH